MPQAAPTSAQPLVPPVVATPPAAGRMLRARDTSTGDIVSFMWHDAAEPTESDLAEVFAAHRTRMGNRQQAGLATGGTTTPPEPSFTSKALDTATSLGTGALKSLGRAAIGAGELVAPVLRAVPGVRGYVATPKQFEAARAAVTPQGTAEKVGAFAGDVAQFAVPAGKVVELGAGVKAASALVKAGMSARRARQLAMGIDAVAQGATAGGVATIRGDEGVGTTAAINTVAPFIGKAITLAAPAIRAKAEQKLASLLATGLEGTEGNLVQHALKVGGDAVRPSVGQAVKIVHDAAGELLDLPVFAGWGKWQTMLASRTESAKKLLGAALDSSFGDVRAPTAPVMQAIDDLIESATRHLAETRPLSGSGTLGDTAPVIYNQPLFKELIALKQQLATYGEGISVRNLVDIKRTWDDVVYTLATSGKVNADPSTLISSAMKKAAFTGANAIRHVLDDSAPTIAKLDEVVSHAIRLEDLVAKVAASRPGMSEAVRNIATSAGAGAGAILSGGGYAQHVLGAGIGATATRYLTRALESPLWATLPATSRNALARALQAGRADDVVRIVAPIVSATPGTTTKAEDANNLLAPR